MIRRWLQRRWERRVGHVYVGEWLLDLGMPTPLAIRLKKLHDKQHPDSWQSCELCCRHFQWARGGRVVE